MDKKAEEIKVAAAKLTDSSPGTVEYLACHRKAATELRKRLKDTKLESYKTMAEQWNNQGAPVRIQEKYVCLSTHTHNFNVIAQRTKATFGNILSAAHRDFVEMVRHQNGDALGIRK